MIVQGNTCIYSFYRLLCFCDFKNILNLYIAEIVCVWNAPWITSGIARDRCLQINPVPLVRC